ncbi:caax prenyl protease 2 [Quercus suber]|uniref:intramembrane prenyl-peptidase Rce1 n=1 Tax=Quercus suber TaxID=58331 RepID=A0AAW0M674_QUESU
MEEEAISKSAAVAACTAMALLYVAILHAPTLILRLPPPPSFNSFMIRRFIGAAISSWQAVVFPVSLTCLMYAGSLVLKALLLVDKWRERVSRGEELSYEYIQGSLQGFIDLIISVASNVSAWRNFFVAPLTEELVFRACMIPLLLCGGFKPYTAIRLCPIFFSLAHLNHLMEFYSKQNFSLIKTFMVAGLQLGYTVIFGSYASFLYIRTGMVSVAFVAGMVGFLWLLFPMTHPDLYNDRSDSCKCWHGYCSWS